jgi:histidine triad (HIT) family protein
MSSEDCLFCKMVSGQIPVTKIYEDNDILCFMDIGPISEGHTLVITKQHVDKVHECPPEILSRTVSKLGRIAGAVAAAMNSDGYNILNNNGKVAGQHIQHLHFHIIPRKKGDGVFDRWPSFKYPEGKIDVIADKIRQKL